MNAKTPIWPSQETLKRESGKTSTVQGLRLFEPSTCLLTELANHLAENSPEVLSSTAVLLPTMRLRVQLLGRIMHRRQAAYVPPGIVTLAPFIAQHLEKLQRPPSDDRRAADPFELHLIGTDLLEKPAGGVPWRHLRPSHLKELLLLYKEAGELSLVENYQQRVEELMRQESTHAEAALAGFKERLEEAGTFFTRLTEALKEQNLQSPQELAKAEAGLLLKHIQQGSWVPKGPILIAGLTSLAPYHVTLVKELMRRNLAEVWLSQPPDAAMASRSPLAALIEELRAPVQKELFQNVGKLREASPPAVLVRPNAGGVIRCSSVDDEITAALHLVEQSLRANVPPQAIGLVVNGERSYTLPLLQRTQNQSTLFNFALPLTFRLTPVGSWVAALVDFLGDPDNVTHLLDLLCHPFSLDHIHKKFPTLLPEGDASTLANHICQDIGRLSFIGSLEGLAKSREKPILAAAVSWALEVKQDLLGGKLIHSLLGWCATLKDMVATLPSPEVGRLKAALQPTLAYAEPALHFFEKFMEEVQFSKLGAQTGISLDEFRAFLREHLLDEPIHRIGEPLAGVQVIQFSESRYVPFAVSILLGCHEGDLPSRLPQDEVIDHFTKPSLGFRPQQYLESLQDLNVALLFSRIQTVYLLYNQGNAKSPNIASRYVQMLITAGFRELTQPTRPFYDQPVSKPLKLPPTLEATDWFLPTEPISVSALRNFIGCPFHFKAKSLKIAPLHLPSARLTPQVEGTMLHAILESFFSGKCTRLPHLRQRSLPRPPKSWPTDALGFQSSVTAHLMLISEQILPRSPAGQALLLQLRLRSWPAFAQFLWNLPLGHALASNSNHMDGKAWQEWSFNSQLNLSDAAGNSRQLLLRGSVDLILKLGDVLLIIDYKRRQVPTQVDVTLGIDPQLSAYELGTQTLGPFPQAVAGYWNILEGKWFPRLRQNAEVMEGPAALLLKKSTPIAAQAVHSIAELIHMRHRAMQKMVPSDLSPFYADSSQCGRCDLVGVCRKNDPRFSLGIQQNRHLAAWKIENLQNKKVKI